MRTGMEKGHGSIRARFISIFMLITTPFLCVSLFFSWHSEKMLRDKLFKEVEGAALAFVQGFEAEYARIWGLEQSLLLDMDLMDLVRRGSRMDRYAWVQSVNRLQDKLRDYKSISPYIQEMSLYLPTVQRVLSAPYGQRSTYDEFTPRSAQRFAALLKEGGGAAVRDNALVIFFAHRNGQAADYLVETVTSVQQLLGAPGTLRTGSGYFLYQPGGGILARPESLDLARALASQLAGAPAQCSATVEGTPYLVVSKPFSFSGLMLVSYIDEGIQLKPLAVYRGWFFAAICLFFGMTLTYALVVQKYLSHPVSVLLEHFEHVRSGNLDLRIQEQRSDEFGVLFTQFNATVERLGSVVLQSLKQTIYLQKAELKQLQAQINPHFLYNSYFLLHRLIKRGDPFAAEFSKFLGQYFRYIAASGQEEASLEEECAHAGVYARIQAVRFQGRIRVEFPPCPKEMAQLKAPRLILQPILENAFLYGLEDAQEEGVLRVDYRVTPSACQILVHNTGKPMPQDTLRRLNEALSSPLSPAECSGLVNIHRRLQLTFGEGSGIAVQNTPDGVTIVMTIGRREAA